MTIEEVKKYIDVCMTQQGVKSYAELARLGSMSSQNLNQILNQNKTISLENLNKIAAALNCTVDVKFIDKNTGKPLSM